MFFRNKVKEILKPRTINKTNELDFLYSSFPSEFHDDVSVVIDVLKKTDKVLSVFFTEEKIRIQYHQEVLLIPYRFYAKQVLEEKLQKLTLTQLTIFNCIYTRSNDGYIRQKYVEKVLQLENIPEWVIPYIIKLCGEYVVEILHTINDHFVRIDVDILAEFVKENKAFVHFEYCHMMSYWDENYRYKGVPKLKGYIGYELFQKNFGHNRSFERYYLDTLPPKEPKQKIKLEIFLKTVDLDQNYFFMPINGDQISTEQFGLIKSKNSDEFFRSSDGSKWRERLLYNTGYGQPKGFERLPALDFDQLIYIALSNNRFQTKLTQPETTQNVLGSVAVIMDDHLDEFVEFLTQQINNTDLFDDEQYRENLKLFCVDDTKSKGVGGNGKFSYEDFLNMKGSWFWLSRKVKDKIYRNIT